METGRTPQSETAVGRNCAEGFGTAASTAGSPGASVGADRSFLPPTLRPYQLAALAAIRAEFEAGCRGTLLELPTGTGKTVVFAELGRQEVANGNRVLVLTQSIELIAQAEKKFADVGVWTQVEQGKRSAGSAPVVIASVQSLVKRLHRFAPTTFSKIVVDEGHHAAASSYLAILAHFPGARVLLVTATPDRGDGKALGKVVSTTAFRYTLREAIRDGWLVPLRARRVLVDGVDLRHVAVHHGDFDQRELAAVFGAEKALHGVAAPLLELSAGLRTIAFCVDVQTARALASVINSYEPGAARAVDGSASLEERRRVLADFRAGHFRILVNCALYTEGFDEPSVQCVAIIRPTRSRALYVQMLGRVTRLLGLSYAESVRNGKRVGIVLDFVGASKHALVGPADALAGADAIDDDLRDAIEKRLEAEQLGIEEVIASCEDELAKRRKSLKFTAIAEYRTKEIDPFLGDFFKPNRTEAWAAEPATDKQRSALKKIGIEQLPEQLTKGEASDWLDAHSERMRRGLCSLKLARMLERANFDTREMTAVRAKQIHVALIKLNYKHPLLSHLPEYKPGWTRKKKAGAK